MSKYIKVLTAAGFACLPVMASAAAPTLTEVLAASGTTLDAYITGSYTYGFNDGQALGGRTFDGETDAFKLNQAAFTLSKLPAQGAGGLVNVIAGDDAAAINAAYGDTDDNINVTQAFLQYATGSLTVMGGRFVTLAGTEVINDTANANISRGFLFTLVQPAVHTGVRTSYKMGGTTLYAGLSNTLLTAPPPGASELDQQKTLELGVAFAPSSSSSLAIVGYHSADEVQAGGADTDTLIDVVGSLQASSTLQLGANFDYRTTDFGTSDDQKIWGLALYGNMKFSPSTRGSLRIEHVDFSDVLGFAGADNDVQSYTATVGHMVASNLELLAEVRLDNSDLSVFPDGASPAEDSQGDVAVKAIYKF
ncbi:MAG TPA: outer membrane beta-barrel protein [Solimonas sp.]|nr:outer membrane beta-barrel protein [Solimonas sp.]